MEKNRVFFHKPNLELFDSIGLRSVDMHFHSRYSDSYTRVQTILKKARKLSMGVAITDHNTIQGSIKACDNTKGVMVIPGVEISCMEGPHILLYFYSINELEEFYNKHIEPHKQGNPYMAIKLKAEEVIERASNYNCLRTAAHPYGYYLNNIGLSKCTHKHYVDENIFNSIDFMEVICGAMNRKMNKKAIKRSQELGKGITGGTDGHTIFELGKVVTSSYADDINAFLDNIAKKKNYVIGKETKLVPKLLPTGNMVTKHMKYAMPTIKVQYEINKHRVRSVPRKILNKGKELKNRIIKKA